MNETRRDPREPIELKLRYKSASVDEFAERESGDLSVGGIFIKSEEPLPIGTLLKFEVQLSDETSIIAGVGRVVWNRSAEASSEDAPTGMGIKFVKMDDESRARLEALIERRGAEKGAYDEVPAQDEALGGEDAAEDAPSEEEPPSEEEASASSDEDVTVKLEGLDGGRKSEDTTESRDEGAQPSAASSGPGRLVAIAGLVAIIVAGAYWALARDSASSGSQIDTAERAE